VFASFANVVWRMSRLKDVLQRARDQPRTGGKVSMKWKECQKLSWL
jgi:hypothetical protein